MVQRALSCAFAFCILQRLPARYFFKKHLQQQQQGQPAGQQVASKPASLSARWARGPDGRMSQRRTRIVVLCRSARSGCCHRCCRRRWLLPLSLPLLCCLLACCCCCCRCCCCSGMKGPSRLHAVGRPEKSTEEKKKPDTLAPARFPLPRTVASPPPRTSSMSWHPRSLCRSAIRVTRSLHVKPSTREASMGLFGCCFDARTGSRSCTPCAIVRLASSLERRGAVQTTALDARRACAATAARDICRRR